MSLPNMLKAYVIPRTGAAKIVWISGIAIMLLSAFHFIIEYAPKNFPSLLHDHTALTDFIYDLDVNYETSAMVFIAGTLLMASAYSLTGASPQAPE